MCSATETWLCARSDRYHDSQFRGGSHVDGVISHAHAGNRSQAAGREDVVIEPFRAGEHRVDAGEVLDQPVWIDECNARRRINDLKPSGGQQFLARSARCAPIGSA